MTYIPERLTTIIEMLVHEAHKPGNGVLIQLYALPALIHGSIYLLEGSCALSHSIAEGLLESGADTGIFMLATSAVYVANSGLSAVMLRQYEYKLEPRIVISN
ncbi:MAG: hypothetical protein U5L45_11850 [Saprospiraceae bacterium]|nr:hypothetical protein [Saprospiraceae bacterium]